jgi:outer membrane protein assembly factor BamB
MRLALAVMMAAFPLCAQDHNWPRFRGSAATGLIQNDPALPESWSDTENVKWRADIPGHGWSSPVVWGDRIFVTSVISS